MQTNLFVGRTRDGTVVQIVGQGTMRESPVFRRLVEASLQRGPITFDATQCEYLDSTFLGCLIALQKKSEQLGTPLTIAASRETQLRLFSLSSLDKYFDFVAQVPPAVEPLKQVDVDQLDVAELGRHIMQCHGTLAERGGSQAGAFRAIADRLAEELGDMPPRP